MTSLNGMVKHLQAPARMTFMNLDKTKMWYLYAFLQTSLLSLKDVSESAPSLSARRCLVKSHLSFVIPSSALQACTWPRHRLRLFVCVFILARLSGLNDKTVK